MDVSQHFINQRCLPEMKAVPSCQALMEITIAMLTKLEARSAQSSTSWRRTNIHGAQLHTLVTIRNLVTISIVTGKAKGMTRMIGVKDSLVQVRK